MLFILTGDIQIGKTRWLLELTRELTRDGVVCAGVVAPGIWVPSENGDENGFEKLGIENVLLPQNERIPFATRRDLALADGTLDPSSQSARMKLGWEISDAAITQVNAHFDDLAKAAGGGKAPEAEAADGKAVAGADGARGTATPGTVGPCAAHSGCLLVVDELGRLELLRGQGLTSALALLDAGPAPAFPHALIVVREMLIAQARERFANVWGNPVAIGPDDNARLAVRRAFGLDS